MVSVQASSKASSDYAAVANNVINNKKFPIVVLLVWVLLFRILFTGDNKSSSSWVEVLVTDSIYREDAGWGVSPMVDERSKLVIFSQVGNAQAAIHHLFRNLKGLPLNVDWATVFNPQTNGLTYLYHYNTSMATHIMNSPEYTRAIFVRDPKERFLASFLQFANANFLGQACCPVDHSCVEKAETMEGFLALTTWCNDIHWTPQSDRLPHKFLPMLNFVGYMDTLEQDLFRLLEKVGLWNDFGATGYGNYYNASLVDAYPVETQATKRQMLQYYTPKMELFVEERYAMDYMVPEFGLMIKRLNYN